MVASSSGSAESLSSAKATLALATYVDAFSSWCKNAAPRYAQGPTATERIFANEVKSKFEWVPEHVIGSTNAIGCFFKNPVQIFTPVNSAVKSKPPKSFVSHCPIHIFSHKHCFCLIRVLRIQKTHTCPQNTPCHGKLQRF